MTQNRSQLPGLDGFVQHRDTKPLQLAATLVTAIGRHHDRWDCLRKVLPQRSDNVPSRYTLIEVVVGEDHLRRRSAEHRQRRF